MERLSVSVVIPCRNEARFIAGCLDSILANDYPETDLEILVVDGLSSDGTREIVQQYARTHANIKLLMNPDRTSPAALNVGIARSSGEYISRLDAHGSCETAYFTKCLAAIHETGADNVGGSWSIRPRDPTHFGRAIAVVIGHWFGAGNAHYKIGSRGRRWVDTVPFGFYKREVFDRVGLFNESLIRNQDLEFNLRLRRAGGRILLDPDITLVYYARSALGTFARHNYVDGYWVFYGAAFSQLPLTWRHLVPVSAIALASSLALLNLLSPMYGFVLAALCGAYALLNVFVSLKIAIRNHESAMAFTLPVTFLIRHLAYGVGSAMGVAALLPKLLSGRRVRNRRRRSMAQRRPT
jgi:glycosyltransferase involved in cell wall biosynthesis